MRIKLYPNDTQKPTRHRTRQLFSAVNNILSWVIAYWSKQCAITFACGLNIVSSEMFVHLLHTLCTSDCHLGLEVRCNHQPDIICNAQNAEIQSCPGPAFRVRHISVIDKNRDRHIHMTYWAYTVARWSRAHKTTRNPCVFDGIYRRHVLSVCVCLLCVRVMCRRTVAKAGTHTRCVYKGHGRSRGRCWSPVDE